MKKTILRLSFLVVLGLLITACSNSTDPSSGTISAKFDGEIVKVFNDSIEPIYVFAVGANVQPLVLWIPSLSDELRVGQSSQRSFDLLTTGLVNDSETEVVVYWWQSVLNNGQLEPGDIKDFKITVQSNNPFTE